MNTKIILVFIFATILDVSAATSTNVNPQSGGSSIKDFFAGNHPFQNEVLVNFSTGEFTSQKACTDCSSVSTFTLFGSYLHHLKDNFQLGGEAGITSSSSTTLFDLAAIGAYNVESDFKNSIYGKAGLGLASVSGPGGSGSETKIGFFIGGGKRFAIFNNVTYSPELRIIKKGDLDVAFQATFLNLSLYWN